MNTQHQDALEALGRRLEARGFRFRAAPYFGPNGIVVFTPAIQRDSGSELSVIERGVFLYHSGSGWEARVTRHGGPHWTRQAETLDALEEVALEALGTSKVPPNPSWRIEA